jgi:hypothetical protein
MNYDFYNLYGSSSAIFSQLGAMAVMPHFKISDRIYAYLGHFGLLGHRMRGAVGKHRPQYREWRQRLSIQRKKACRTPYRVGVSEDALSHQHFFWIGGSRN